MTDQMTTTGPRASECDDWGANWFAARRGPWFALIWLPVLIVAPLVSNIASGNVTATITYVLIAAWYVVTVVVPYRGVPQWMSELCVAVLTALVVAQFVISHDGQGFLYPLLAIAAATAIRRRYALGIVMGLSISGSIAEGIATWSLANALLFGFASVVAGVSTYLIGALVDIVAELRSTRRRLAGLAVAEERQRFSRDLHDLLGHTLSVIVVKAEAIRRFAASDPDSVVNHARGIEDVGRTALADVRQAVAGYRELRLEHELSGATEALEDAGVSMEASRPVPALSPQTDALFAWVVREATTNVIRHSHATHCTVRVMSGSEGASMEIADNGRGAVAAEWGSGIRGMRERAARAGGTLDVASDARGFTLTIAVPAEGSAS
ncbi:sensor histidine kinase [Paramicrobacterium agarici]|uniref:Two-component system sensor histidine kinase DesK n=1 Tax=Paramicrobacterium agarici TaxID=630514 RepID=A0A2A9DWH2_9MICO|nr:sensor histidine kinase [Microbacterium agarici]PFG30290.1 two-component system sensor histidine kinase DesK [Microbacterium agarici]TQO23297.1 two-component system sensor histidine kinase DesK [Microbacterium agarici]